MAKVKCEEIVIDRYLKGKNGSWEGKKIWIEPRSSFHLP